LKRKTDLGFVHISVLDFSYTDYTSVSFFEWQQTTVCDF
jgi:hypothetical protein